MSRYKDHAIRLFEKLKNEANKAFLMTGNNSKREHKAILEQLKTVSPDESLILVATGKLVGEGFDYPRLDTLIMATPVSFKSVVEQYVGRLNRDYLGKKNVVVYDYVDSHIPFFSNMYAKRLKAYKQIGYKLCTGLEVDRAASSSTGNSRNGNTFDRTTPLFENAIFEGENYVEIFYRDLSAAQSSIIVSSPALSKDKITKFQNLISETQLRGVKTTVITWQPQAYGYGEEKYWNLLHKQLYVSGIYLKLQEKHCDQFALIDQEIIWYGNVNLLATEKEEDNIMRLVDRSLAADLLEITFGKEFTNKNADSKRPGNTTN